MRIRKVMAIAAAVVMITATGCAAGNQDNRSADTEVNSSMDYNSVRMTRKEEELICANFPFDEERIKLGQLSDAQFSALRELRLGVDLIDTKYPGLGYEIIRFTQATKTSGQGIIDIRIEGEGDKEYKAYIIYGEDGEPYALETVYGFEVRDAYDEYLCTLLRDNGVEARTYTDFETPVSNEAGRGTQPEDIIEQGSKIVRYTDVFITEPGDRDAAVAKIRNILEKYGIYAVYEIDFAPSIEGMDIRELEEGRRNYESTSFEVAER